MLLVGRRGGDYSLPGAFPVVTVNRAQSSCPFTHVGSSGFPRVQQEGHLHRAHSSGHRFGEWG